MTGPILHVGATIMCTHGGTVNVAPGNARVMVNGQPAATLSDQFLVAGCAFTIPPSQYHPCLRIQWTTPAARVTAGGQPVLTQMSIGLGVASDSAPQGPPMITVVQSRVMAQ